MPRPSANSEQFPPGNKPGPPKIPEQEEMKRGKPVGLVNEWTTTKFYNWHSFPSIIVTNSINFH